MVVNRHFHQLRNLALKVFSEENRELYLIGEQEFETGIFTSEQVEVLFQFTTKATIEDWLTICVDLEINENILDGLSSEERNLLGIRYNIPLLAQSSIANNESLYSVLSALDSLTVMSYGKPFGKIELLELDMAILTFDLENGELYSKSLERLYYIRKVKPFLSKNDPTALLFRTWLFCMLYIEEILQEDYYLPIKNMIPTDYPSHVGISQKNYLHLVGRYYFDQPILSSIGLTYFSKCMVVGLILFMREFILPPNINKRPSEVNKDLGDTVRKFPTVEKTG